MLTGPGAAGDQGGVIITVIDHARDTWSSVTRGTLIGAFQTERVRVGEVLRGPFTHFNPVQTQIWKKCRRLTS